MKGFLKGAVNGFFRVIVSPLWLLVILIDGLSGREDAFQFFAQSLGSVPGKPGEFIRRAYYRWTLAAAGKNLVVGYGSFFTHRAVWLEDNVWIAQYAIIGMARIGANTMFGEHGSILSGRHHHTFESDGSISDSRDRLTPVSIGRNCWIGANCTVMANVGEGCIIGGGSVVVRDVEPFSVAAGNPASLIRKLEAHHGQ